MFGAVSVRMPKPVRWLMVAISAVFAGLTGALTWYTVSIIDDDNEWGEGGPKYVRYLWAMGVGVIFSMFVAAVVSLVFGAEPPCDEEEK